METNAQQLESLLEKATDYGKTSFELIKLKALDKSSDVVSTLTARSVVLVIIASFMLFLNLGLALWLGEILGKTFYGFFVIAAFYGIAGLFVHFFMHKWIKRIACNYFIKQVLK